MQLMERVTRYAAASVAVAMFAACSGQKAPAQKSIDDIEATVTSASPEAAKYIPDQLMAVQTGLGGLKTSYERKDYAAVLSDAPAVLSSAQSLATAAAAKKDEILKTQNDAWAALAAAVPAHLTELEERIALLGKKPNQKMAAGIDLGAAQTGTTGAASLWSKAQAAFATGNLEEAVSTGKNVESQIAALASALKFDLATEPESLH